MNKNRVQYWEGINFSQLFSPEIKNLCRATPDLLTFSHHQAENQKLLENITLLGLYMSALGDRVAVLKESLY
jgi:hypothetical protein